MLWWWGIKIWSDNQPNVIGWQEKGEKIDLLRDHAVAWHCNIWILSLYTIQQDSILFVKWHSKFYVIILNSCWKVAKLSLIWALIHSFMTIIFCVYNRANRSNLTTKKLHYWDSAKREVILVSHPRGRKVYLNHQTNKHQHYHD